MVGKVLEKDSRRLTKVKVTYTSSMVDKVMEDRQQEADQGKGHIYKQHG